jgi:phosphoribosylaminoimidazole-succinocarboxamide synthase
MGARLSPVREAVPLLKGLTLLNRGKVRDTYDLGDNKLLIVTTDAISIMDFVLNETIPLKGIILNAMNHFWINLLAGYGLRSHLIAAGSDIDQYLPATLGRDPDLQARAMVVKKLTMRPVEFIARRCLTGSGYDSYLATGTVNGHNLPPGLQNGDLLPFIIDTPTTKAESGHDQALNPEEIFRRYPEETYQFLKAFQVVSAHAQNSGVIMADTKVEMGVDEGGQLMFGDELFTPDSSRYWDAAEWFKSRQAKERKPPTPLDKQLVRNWGIEQGVKPLDPSLAEHCQTVYGLKMPSSLILNTTRIYRYIFWRLTGITIEQYCKEVLGVSIPHPTKKIAIVFGSESDIDEQTREVLRGIQDGKYKIPASITVHVISCHRNPGELREFVQTGCRQADIIIAAGGKAFALPGVLDALIAESGKSIPVVGVALGEPGSEARQAAVLSIKQLPGQPVVMDELAGEVFTDLAEALNRVINGELLPPKSRQTKPAKLDIDF